MYVTIEVLIAFCALLVDLITLVVLIFQNRGPLNILRAMSGEKIFRQSKQKFARRVHPLRRNFVTNDGKDSVDSSREEFLEVPNNKKK